MARRVMVIVLGVWLGILTVVAVHLLTSRRVAPFHNGTELAERRSESRSGLFIKEREVDGGTSNSRYKLIDEHPETGINLRQLRVSEGVASTHTADENNPRAAFEQVVALSTLLPKITNISRLKTPSPEAFRNYIAPLGFPVIFTDMFDGSLLRQWSWDYIKGKWGHHIFHNTRQGNYSSKKTSSGKYFVNRVTVTLAGFIDVVTGQRAPTESEKGLYITKQKVIPTEALETEFFYPPFYPGPHKNCYLEPTAW